MNIQETSRIEYRARINRVTDYIDRHLDGPLDLATLAGVAHFSPFHFHRIFTMMTGETPADYVQRVRVERAASILLNDPHLTITEIADSCGFGSVSLFSRSFRAALGVTAKEYRQREKPIFAHNGLRYSKNGQLLGKNLKPDVDFDAHLCSVNLKNITLMDAKIEIKEMPELRVAYVRHMGQYDQIGKAYEKLMRWAGPRGLLGPWTKTVTVYQDDPAVTAIEKVRQDACITLAHDVNVEGEVGKAMIAGGKYAVGRFQVDQKGFEKAWNTICLWLADNGYQYSGSPYELYHNALDDIDGKNWDVEICIPVKPL
jgi:AraC family transcriptional regulator